LFANLSTLVISDGERNGLITTLVVLCSPHHSTIQAVTEMQRMKITAIIAIGAPVIHAANTSCFSKASRNISQGE